LPIEVKRKRGTLRPGRIPRTLSIGPTCAECGACGPLFSVTNDVGESWGPFCRVHADEAVEIIEGGTR
jgi:hypothetical protein